MRERRKEGEREREWREGGRKSGRRRVNQDFRKRVVSKPFDLLNTLPKSIESGLSCIEDEAQLRGFHCVATTCYVLFILIVSGFNVL